MGAVFYLLNLTNPLKQPPFASSVAFELREDVTNNTQYYIRVLLKNNQFNESISFKEIKLNGK